MIVLEIGALIVIIFLQWRYFNRSLEEIEELKNLFPSVKLSEENLFVDESTQAEQILVGEHKNHSFHNILFATNQYLKKNLGSADYNIIKNIADRTTEAQEEKIASEISLPLYLGLMGTFAGVILGLLSMVIDGGFDMASTGNDKKVQGLIAGVIIAMTVSLIGLLLTTINNSINLKKAIAVRNINRNNYYNFLQTELLPHLDNNIYSALDQLKLNISNFNIKFEENLGLFDESFSDNIQHLKGTVAGMTEQIKVVNENTKVQLEFLQELKKIGYNRMAEANIKVFDKLKETGPMLIKFIQEQQKLNVNVESANEFATKIGDLLDRVNTFENSINSLGREVQQSEMLGAEVINVVRKHLSVIDQRESLITEYTGRSNSEIESYLRSALERMQLLKREIEVGFQKSFDFDSEGNVLQNLLYLSTIDANVRDLKAKVTQLEGAEKVKPSLDLIIEELKKNPEMKSSEVMPSKSTPLTNGRVSVTIIEPKGKRSWWSRITRRKEKVNEQ